MGGFGGIMNKKKSFTFRLDEFLLEKLKKLAARKKITVGELIRVSLQSLLKIKDKK
jgi:predicted DNA-binding ribbon-helix-helix protein